MQVERLQDGVATQPGQLPVDSRPQVVGPRDPPTDSEAVRDGVEERFGSVQVAWPPRRDVLGGRRVDDESEVATPPHAIESLRKTVDERRRPERIETGPGGAVTRVDGRGQLVMGHAATQQTELVVRRLDELKRVCYTTTLITQCTTSRVVGRATFFLPVCTLLQQTSLIISLSRAV